MFIQVIQGQVSDPDELRAGVDRWARELGPGATGWLGSTSGVTDDGTALAVVRFDSEEAARRNSERPEQHQWWMETSKLFTGPVTFHDCRETGTWLRGGSDDAGFVQVMQGRVHDAQRLMEINEESGDAVARVRPEIIGGTYALHGDGTGTLTTYFTSEADARAGEQKEMPEEIRPLMEEEGRLFTDITFYDLREPVLHSSR